MRIEVPVSVRLSSLFRLIACTTIAVGLLCAGPGTTRADEINTLNDSNTGRSDIKVISLNTGHSVVINLRGVRRIAVGDGKVAGVVAIGTGQVVINAKSTGRTTIQIWCADGLLTYDVSVLDSPLDDLAIMLRTTLDEPSISINSGPYSQVTQYRSVIVRGQVDDIPRFQRLEDILSRFTAMEGHQKFDIVNSVTIRQPLGNAQATLESIPNTHNLRMDPDGHGNIIVSGEALDRATAENVLDKARQLSGPYLPADGKVVDRLSLDQVSQIGIKVYVLEIDASGMSQLGIRLQGANPDPTLPNVLDYGSPTFLFAEVANLPGKALTLQPFFRETRLAPTLDLILQTGHGRVLSAPNLVTSQGQEATFLVGGEVPYAYSTGGINATTSIVFKPYGISIDMTPKILGNGSVETKIAPEVSELDFSNGIVENGFNVPALKTSQLSTDIVTQPGESIVMGGLLARVETRTVTKIPLLGDLPILGSLFRSTQYQHNETDIVFLMTPEIITR